MGQGESHPDKSFPSEPEVEVSDSETLEARAQKLFLRSPLRQLLPRPRSDRRRNKTDLWGARWSSQRSRCLGADHPTSLVDGCSKPEWFRCQSRAEEEDLSTPDFQEVHWPSLHCSALFYMPRGLSDLLYLVYAEYPNLGHSWQLGASDNRAFCC